MPSTRQMPSASFPILSAAPSIDAHHPYFPIPNSYFLFLFLLSSHHPYICLHAGIAQLVEHNLAKVGVAGSSPVSRSERVRLRDGSGGVSLPFFSIRQYGRLTRQSAHVIHYMN